MAEKEAITIRIEPDLKEEILTAANALRVDMTTFIKLAVQEKIRRDARGRAATS